MASLFWFRDSAETAFLPLLLRRAITTALQPARKSVTERRTAHRRLLERRSQACVCRRGDAVRAGYSTLWAGGAPPPRHPPAAPAHAEGGSTPGSACPAPGCGSGALLAGRYPLAEQLRE